MLAATHSSLWFIFSEELLHGHAGMVETASLEFLLAKRNVFLKSTEKMIATIAGKTTLQLTVLLAADVLQDTSTTLALVLPQGWKWH